jgi:hypothetical protein
VLIFALTLAACTSTRSADEPAPEPTPELAVTVLQQRVDATTRVVGVETTNREHAPVHVSAVRLSGGGLDGPTTPLDTDLLPKLTVALRTSYGRPMCDDRGGPVTAHLKIGGTWFAYAVDAAGNRQVRRLLVVDCARIALANTAAVRLAGPYRPVTLRGEPYLRGRLLMVRRAAGATVDLRSLGGSVLIDLRHVGQLQDLAAGADRAETPVLLGSSGRCDPHSLGQSTQTFLLSAYVRLGDDPEQRVVLTPPRPVQDRILEVITRACDGQTSRTP